MERRFSRENSREKGSTTLQKKILESKRSIEKVEPVPDLTDFMNDMFFGTVTTEKKSYNLTGGGRLDREEEEDSFDDSTRSNSSRLTQDWLDEARRIVASSPTRGSDSPSKLVGSPRFAAVPRRLSSASIFDRRDPLSRSARRQRSVEGVSEEILTKTAKHTRNRSEPYESTPNSPTEPSGSHVQKWFANLLKPPIAADTTSESDLPSPRNAGEQPPNSSFDPMSPTLPPRLSIHRRSRFQTSTPDLPSPTTSVIRQGIPIPSPRRTFRPAPLPPETKQILSPPKNLIETASRRSLSSSTCSLQESRPFSPPRNLVESAQRRSVSRSTCSIQQVALKGGGDQLKGWKKEEKVVEEISLNGFLKDQRNKIEKILNGELQSKAKVILSGPSNSTSSMVATICYAWLLENRLAKNKGDGSGERCIVIPVMNVRRGKMWRQRQAAWLFHHVGLDATSLLFADEVDLENLMMAGQLNVLVTGQDILKMNSEVVSQCTVLTDNYCEDAYDLLQIPILKKLLLAGILLDTLNLNASSRVSTTRDAEAVQLLLVGSAPTYRNALFDQLMQDQRDNAFFEALRQYYGKPPTENGLDHGAQTELRETERNSTSVCSRDAPTANSDKKSNNPARNSKSNSKDSPKPAVKADPVPPVPAPKPAAAQATPDPNRGKNKNFLAKWFNWGPK